MSRVFSSYRLCVGLAAVSAFVLLFSLSANAQNLFTGKEKRPADAVVLFDGTDTSGWVRDSGEPAGWKVEKGYMEIVPGTGSIHTRQKFGDCQLHVEFWLPLMANAQGQARANSGVYLQGRYEVQVLDSYGLKSQSNDCGGIYGVSAPLVNACRPPESWQTYDIFFQGAKFDEAGKRVRNARISVLQNGIWIQHDAEIPGTTTASQDSEAATPGPIVLQDHGNKIRYRNIWIRPLSTNQ